MTRTRTKPRVLFTPGQREAVKAVKQSVCERYEITESDLINDNSTAVAYLRFYCYWLLRNNTSLSEWAIAEAFSKSRTAVQYGIEKIDSQKDVYRDVAGNLREIALAANKYPKKFEWCIQQTNTNN